MTGIQGVAKSDTQGVAKSDTHRVAKSDTYVVHHGLGKAKPGKGQTDKDGCHLAVEVVRNQKDDPVVLSISV